MSGKKRISKKQLRKTRVAFARDYDAKYKAAAVKQAQQVHRALAKASAALFAAWSAARGKGMANSPSPEAPWDALRPIAEVLSPGDFLGDGDGLLAQVSNLGYLAYCALKAAETK